MREDSLREAADFVSALQSRRQKSLKPAKIVE
jgi:hypothetical protein